MRTPSKNLMYADFIIQFLLLIPLILASLYCFIDLDSILLAGFLQFLLGTWQLLSSLYANAILKLKSRRLHILLSSAFLLGAFITYYFTEIFRPGIRVTEFLFSLGLIIPQLIAIYYARQTYIDAKRLRFLGSVDKRKMRMDDNILDAGMEDYN